MATNLWSLISHMDSSNILEAIRDNDRNERQSALQMECEPDSEAEFQEAVREAVSLQSRLLILKSRRQQELKTKLKAVQDKMNQQSYLRDKAENIIKSGAEGEMLHIAVNSKKEADDNLEGLCVKRTELNTKLQNVTGVQIKIPNAFKSLREAADMDVTPSTSGTGHEDSNKVGATINKKKNKDEDN